MDLKEINLFLQHIEKEYPINRWKVDGLHVWPLIRIYIGTVLNSIVTSGMGEISKNDKNDFDVLKRFLNKAKQMAIGHLQLIIHDFKHNQNLQRADVILVGKSIDRNMRMPNGELMDYLMDPFRYELEEKGYSVLKFEECETAFKYPRWRKTYVTDGLIARSLIKKKVMSFIYNDEKFEDESYNHLLDECVQMGMNEVRLTNRQLLWEVRRMEYMSDEYMSLLNIIKPRLVIHAGWYSMSKMALTLAAHKLEIPVVDIQHGMAGESGSHFAYFDWSNMPPSGYELMPDYMWVWNQDGYDSVARWGGEKVTPILGGYPMNLVLGNREHLLGRYYQRQYASNYGDTRPVILFTLQWDMVYPDWILNFINQTDEYTWLIRLHPFVDENERVFLKKLAKKKNIIWEDVANFPLFFLLQNVSMHITMHSSSVIEGEMVGCPSIVLHPSACQMYALQIKRGIAQYVDTPEKLPATIASMLSERKRDNDNKKIQIEAYMQGQKGIEKLIQIMKPCNN